MRHALMLTAALCPLAAYSSLTRHVPGLLPAPAGEPDGGVRGAGGGGSR